jgi:hypothetical protein
MKLPNLPWVRFIGEGTLIIISVYLAIVLEGMSRDREAELSAQTTLAQILDDMRQDLLNVDEIKAHQLVLDRKYTALFQWLASPESMPLDSVAEAMDTVFLTNRTLYPRRSGWTTMVAAGQLSDLNAPDLVARLGNFYESVNPRLIDGGLQYDESLSDIGRNSGTRIWDGFDSRLLTTDVRQLTVFRNQLRFLHIWGNLWYLDRLDDYKQALEILIAEIESYLQKNNFEKGT